MTKDQVKILHKITEEITSNLYAVAQEGKYPSHSADESDDKIKRHTKAAEELRVIREQLEGIFTGAD